MTVRVRFAPAPSGTLHVGGARTALFNWLYARHHGGAFVLRIEDTDRTRVTEESMLSLMDALRWLGLDWDEGPDAGGPLGPYRQSERFPRYHEALRVLSDGGHAYRCFCTPEELAARRKAAFAAGRAWRYDRRCLGLSDDERAAFEREGRPAAWRFRVPAGETVLADLVLGDVRFDHAEMSDAVIMRSNGTPTYVLAAGIDDVAMEITHVIRGKDLLNSTPEQMMIHRALGAARSPEYAHLPLLIGPDRQPLSKRHGAVSVEAYREQGFVPEAMVNYLALLGWSYGDGLTERFTIPELIEAFELKGVTQHDAAFDVEKLTALNGEKLRELSDDALATRIEPFLVRAGVFGGTPDERSLLGRAVPLVKERLRRLDDAPDWLECLFRRVAPDEKAQRVLGDRARLGAAVAVLEAVRDWTAASIQEALQGWAGASESKAAKKEALQAVRAAVTGRTVTPPLFETMELLGRDESLARIRAVT